MAEQEQTLTIQQAIDLAVQHHNEGRLSQAESIYNQILQSDPNQPIALHLLGVIAHQVGKNDTAVDLITKAISIKPDYAEAHNNLGLAFRVLGRLDEAVASYQKALNLQPEYAVAHNNLGNALKDLGKPEEAISSYQKALNLKPDYVNALNNFGLALRELGRLEDALQIFESIDTPECYAHVLECLFALGEYDKFYEKQTASARNNEINTRVAAINAFASHQLNRSDPHPFCPTPLKFVRVCEPLDGVDDADGFLCDLMDDLQSREAIWEPPGKTTRHGFQTMSNLFKKPYGRLVELDRIIKDTIENYRFEFSSENCDFIRLFPKTLSLSGWFIRLIKGGHQTEHIHSGAWLSGIFYLQMPKCTDQEEGSIELGLWGYDYPILNKSYPKNRFYPKNGGLILFPSSLFHRTIPFHSDEERMSIAFDLRPTQT